MAKVLIRSARESFRRCGITFTRAGVVVDTDDLTKEQIETLTAEPQLSIGPVPEEAGDDGDGGDKAGAKKAGAKKAAK